MDVQYLSEYLHILEILQCPEYYSDSSEIEGLKQSAIRKTLELLNKSLDAK